MKTPTSSSEHLIKILREIADDNMGCDDTRDTAVRLHNIADFWEGQNKATVAALNIFHPCD